MAIGDEVALASDPNESDDSSESEAEAEISSSSGKKKEEEEELVDPQDTKKEACSESSECAKVKARLDDCTERISNNGSTDETCEEELFDFLHCVDACVSKSLFDQLK